MCLSSHTILYEVLYGIEKEIAITFLSYSDFSFNLLRREGDSNPRYPLGVYTLSRRASSTTRAPLLVRGAKVREVFGITKYSGK